MYEAEYCGIHPDAEGQRQQRCSGKRWSLLHPANGMAEILKKLLHGAPPHASRLLSFSCV